MAKIETIFLIFWSSSFFHVFSRISRTIMTCLLFCGHLDALLAEGIFSLDFSAFVIFKKFITFSSFLVQVVCKRLFFHDLASSIFREFL